MSTRHNQLFSFDLDGNRNYLINVTGSTTIEPGNPIVSIGKFSARNEAIYKMQNEQNHLFVFVIEGVFEVQGMLLQSKDGLGLRNEGEGIELEALSNDSIVLIIELNKSKY